MKTSNGNSSIMDMFEKGKVLKICAPMVRYSKLAFRSLVRKYNCDICFTPMIVAADFMRSIKARDSEFTTNESDRPLIVQFAAHDAQTLADAACVVAPFSDGVDLNCGCPQRWAMSAGYGACLINKPELVKDMVRHVRNQVDNPNYTASIKIRIHKDLRRTVDLCQKAESAGVSWITVHGRTAEERHQPVHYDAIKTIKDSVSIPVIANGDIKYLRDVESTHQLTGVDGRRPSLKMTLQWTAVAIFLYVEIGVLVILCIPFISARRWQSIFQLRIWSWMARFWNKVFLTMIIVLIVLFLDAVREVRKYSSRELGTDAKVQPNMYDHLHMKLFRAQRNLYISGFAVFLWLVMKRVVTLINQLAAVSGTTAALQAQADNANKAAKKYMEDNELLKQTLMEGKGDKATAEGMELLRKEVEKLKDELKTSGDALKNSQSEADVMRKQMDGLAREYDRLLKEHQELQNLQDSGNKKED
ncbi:B-cell receptor-associated protein 29-like isoform X2 [Epinephelus fuscoguttatus]|uniref:B-cell receptor-associated protein 29-like isoform X2 n=1 Tax=Epinephelus fuscoguttatus TaxID=293821 RepID=UPI0020D0C4F7|nr:B-cell receptor-associated protein 29-like isoform X2 [Epinephelus fuscoguttatus]XP_049888403.1 B-cell receptor-associated protein 29-like isoform X2 [Epinephelus moara]